MKKEKKVLKIMSSLVSLVLFVMLGAMSINAAVYLPSINIPKGSKYAYSKTFSVSTTGEIKVPVNVAVKGFLGLGKTTKFRVDLVKGNTNVVTTKYVTTNNKFKRVYLRYVVSSCSKKGTYRIRIKNTSSTNTQVGIATFQSFNLPTPSYSRKGIVNRQGLKKNQGITYRLDNYRISRTVHPKDGTRLEIFGVWKGSCGFDRFGCRLKFTLRKGSSIVATATGYSRKAFGVPNNKKMKIVYNLPPSRNGISRTYSDYSLEVKGDSRGDTEDIWIWFERTDGCK